MGFEPGDSVKDCSSASIQEVNGALGAVGDMDATTLED